MWSGPLGRCSRPRHALLHEPSSGLRVLLPSPLGSLRGLSVVQLCHLMRGQRKGGRGTGEATVGLGEGVALETREILEVGSTGHAR